MNSEHNFLRSLKIDNFNYFLPQERGTRVPEDATF